MKQRPEIYFLQPKEYLFGLVSEISMQSKYDPSNLPKIRILLLCTNSTAQANIPICVRVQELYIVFVVGRFSDLVILLQDRVHVTWCHEKLLVSRRQQRMHSEKKNKFIFFHSPFISCFSLTKGQKHDQFNKAFLTCSVKHTFPQSDTMR